jgi:glycosyltransferase involved in cell wall biosynthesis
LSVLSLGYARGVWEGPGAEDYRRLMAYARRLSALHVVTHSYKAHRLERCWLAPNVEAIPTDARGKLHSVLRMWGIAWSVLRHHRVDVIQAQDPVPTGLLGLVLGRLFRVPVNVGVFGPNPYDAHWLRAHWTHQLQAPMARLVLRLAQGVQVDGRLTAERLIAAGLDHVRVKPMVPTNIKEFFGLERPAERAVTRLLYVGRLVRQKNLDLLLDVVRALRSRKTPEFEVKLVGDGPELGRLKAIIQGEGLSQWVALTGALPRDQIAATFADADVLLLTSDYEGYPRVLMEATAAALPVVTTAVSGASEAVIEGESGYVVPIGDAEAFADRIVRLLADPSTRVAMGAAARRHARSVLDPAASARIQIAIWDELAAGGAPHERQGRG